MLYPRVGNINAATTLNKKITLILCATSSSSASITGAVAAIADPPHIDEPTPIRQATFLSIFITLIKSIATKSDTRIVEIITGNDCAPTFAIVPKLRLKPRIITAHCKIFFEVKVTPCFILSLDESFGKMSVIIIPINIANTGAPTTSKLNEPILSFAKKVDSPAIKAQITIPGAFLFINSIHCHS